MSMSSATVAVTTVANAAPMTNATASSIRLPRRMKFLKPLTLTSEWVLERPTLVRPSDGQEARHGRGRDGRDVRLPDAEDHQPSRQPVGGGVGGRWWQRQHQRLAGHGLGGSTLRV